MCIYIYTYIYIYASVSNGKRKPRRILFIRLLFAHRTNGSYPFTNGLAHPWINYTCTLSVHCSLSQFTYTVHLHSVIRGIVSLQVL